MHFFPLDVLYSAVVLLLVFLFSLDFNFTKYTSSYIYGFIIIGLKESNSNFNGVLINKIDGEKSKKEREREKKKKKKTKKKKRRRREEEEEKQEEMDFRCVECGYRINKELFVQYSPGNIRLMKCDNCRAVADEYIECEIMILLIDLILHKPKAYRHLLYNMIHLQAANLECLFWKLALGFLLLDAYRILLLNRSEEEWGLSVSLPSLVSRCGKMLMDLLFGNFVFLCTLLLMTRFFLDESAGVSRYKDILFTIFISSYFKIFLIAMMVKARIAIAVTFLVAVIFFVWLMKKLHICNGREIKTEQEDIRIFVLFWYGIRS